MFDRKHPAKKRGMCIRFENHTFIDWSRAVQRERLDTSEGVRNLFNLSLRQDAIPRTDRAYIVYR